MGPPAGSSRDPDPLNVTPELLAELQAGLLDDATAARVRRQARSDPETARVLAQLDTVRHQLARLGRGETGGLSAPDVPEAVTARVGAALRAASPPAHASGGHTVDRPRLSHAQWAGLIIGMCAAVTAVVLGAFVLTRDPGPAFPPGPTAATITADRAGPSSGPSFPMSDAELRALLGSQNDLGPLADPQRRASCLAGLGYSPAMAILGGRIIEAFDRPGAVLLVPSGTPNQIRAVLVEPTCTAAHTGLLTETVLATRETPP